MGGLVAYEAASHFRPSSQLVVAAIASPDEPSFFATEWEGWSDAVLAAAPVEDFMRVAMQQGLIVNTTLDPGTLPSLLPSFLLFCVATCTHMSFWCTSLYVRFSLSAAAAY
jgi:hypothetical protein